MCPFISTRVKMKLFYGLEYASALQQTEMQFVDRNVTVVFITKCLFKHRPDRTACKNMVQLFYVCLRYNGITSIARRWMLLCFGRGYNNQVTVAFCSSDVTKHVS